MYRNILSTFLINHALSKEKIHQNLFIMSMKPSQIARSGRRLRIWKEVQQRSYIYLVALYSLAFALK